VNTREVGVADLDRLVALLEGYCDFYETAPGHEALATLARHLLANPAEGLQLIAENPAGEAVGFATIYWTWSTTCAARIGVINDLYVTPDARGEGIGRALLEACAERARAHGANQLGWQTAPDNHTAQRLYDAVGGRRESWLDYHLPLG